MKNMLMAITIFAAYLFGAATVYDVELSYNDNFTASQAIQSFIATADSISEVAFFCGRKINSGTYQFCLADSTGSFITDWINSDSAGLYDYKLVSATFNPKVPVRKGIIYQLHIRHSLPQCTTNFYYNRSNPYPDGELIGHPGCDLAARIKGVNEEGKIPKFQNA